MVNINIDNITVFYLIAAIVALAVSILVVFGRTEDDEKKKKKK